MNTFNKLFAALTAKKTESSEPPAEAEPTVVEMVNAAKPAVDPKVNLDITQRITLEGDESVHLGPKIKAQFKPEKGLPVSQAEVDAIPPAQRGASYFSSRPLPTSSLVEITILVGNQERTVAMTKREAQLCLSGSTPRVRAFMIKGQMTPWYEWSKYDPYKHYWAMEERNWTGSGSIIPCLMKVENCDPGLKGYIKPA